MKITDDSLVIYGEALTFEDAEFFIHFKCEEDDWRILIPPYPLQSQEEHKNGLKVYRSGFGFYLHRFHTTFPDHTSEY